MSISHPTPPLTRSPTPNNVVDISIVLAITPPQPRLAAGVACAAAIGAAPPSPPFVQYHVPCPPPLQVLHESRSFPLAQARQQAEDFVDARKQCSGTNGGGGNSLLPATAPSASGTFIFCLSSHSLTAMLRDTTAAVEVD
jgi:hypothetical protein